jgi:hypothetical protein
MRPLRGQTKSYGITVTDEQDRTSATNIQIHTDDD